MVNPLIITQTTVITGRCRLGDDRVHPAYLRAVLLRFGYPLQLVNCIDHLFFDTKLVINENGFLSNSIAQNRGLKQDEKEGCIYTKGVIQLAILIVDFDVLYRNNNEDEEGYIVSFEPFLRSILQEFSMYGFSLPLPNQIPIQRSTVAPRREIALNIKHWCLYKHWNAWGSTSANFKQLHSIQLLYNYFTFLNEYYDR
ncbi:hypothetical protein BDF21DRAFT_450959 [Thamnidium elegans]|nr:hypothetical protein BDF21DRAFT_450959 [Thamnidium elegans]